MVLKKSKRSKKLPTTNFTVTSVAVAGETENGGIRDNTDSNATVAAAASLGQEIDGKFYFELFNATMKGRKGRKKTKR